MITTKDQILGVERMRGMNAAAHVAGQHPQQKGEHLAVWASLDGTMAAGSWAWLCLVCASVADPAIHCVETIHNVHDEARLELRARAWSEWVAGPDLGMLAAAIYHGRLAGPETVVYLESHGARLGD